MENMCIKKKEAHSQDRSRLFKLQSDIRYNEMNELA